MTVCGIFLHVILSKMKGNLFAPPFEDQDVLQPLTILLVRDLSQGVPYHTGLPIFLRG